MIPVAVAYLLLAAATAAGRTTTTFFSTPGTKTVTLKVCAQGGACSTVSKTLTVLDPAPRITSISVPATVGTATGAVPLTARGLGKPPLNYRWTISSPSSPSQVQTTPAWSWVPPLPGSYQLTLTLSNLYGSSSAKQAILVRPNVFGDVAPEFWAIDSIESLYFAGITTGCDRSPSGYPLFCPNANVTRAEVAVLLGRAIHPLPFQPPNPVGLFQDVPPSFWAAAWIEQLHREGVTTGCGPALFCPTATATRAETAVLLERALHGASFTPPPSTGLFADVPIPFWAAAWIEQLAREGITTGCSAAGLLRFFCPAQTLSRAELAAFLERAFHLAQHPTPLHFQASLCTPGTCTYPAGMPLAFEVQLTAGIPTAYDYDWDGDGTFEETATFPIPHTYPTAGSFTPRLRLRRGTSTMTITHPYPIVIFKPNPFSLAPPLNVAVSASPPVPPISTDPPGTPLRSAFQITASSQAGILGYAAFVSDANGYAFAGLLQPNRATAADRLLLPPALPGSASRYLYLRAFDRTGYSPAGLPVRVP